MYCIKLPDDLLFKLYLLREYHNKGTIASQVREAIKRYIQEEEEKLKHPIEEKEDSR